MSAKPTVAPRSGLEGEASPSNADGEFTPAELLSRRQPGDPHRYMLQRNPPNLWILAAMTAGALVAAVIVLVLTVLL